jgi:UDP-N-acetylglucosamine 2-epimerase
MAAARLMVVCGVRPHYVKAASLIRCLNARDLDYILVDARQQYDPSLTDVVIDDLGLRPAVTFEHSSIESAERAGAIYTQLMHLFAEHARGQRVAALGFGDTTTTAMVAMAAISTGSPFIHLEAGVRALRSRVESVENKIRRMLGPVSALNLCVLPEHVDNLRAEGSPGRTVWIGDVGKRLLLEIAATAQPASVGSGVLCLIHKTENVTVDGIQAILRALGQCGQMATLVKHPSIGRLMTRHGLRLPPNVVCVPPAGYRAAVARMSAARVILTDSGSVQREAYYLRRRCVVRRDTMGWVQLAGDRGHVQVGRAADAIADALMAVWVDPSFEAEDLPSFDCPDGERLLADEVRTLIESLEPGS